MSTSKSATRPYIVGEQIFERRRYNAPLNGSMMVNREQVLQDGGAAVKRELQLRAAATFTWKDFDARDTRRWPEPFKSVIAKLRAARIKQAQRKGSTTKHDQRITACTELARRHREALLAWEMGGTVAATLVADLVGDASGTEPSQIEPPSASDLDDYEAGQDAAGAESFATKLEASEDAEPAYLSGRSSRMKDRGFSTLEPTTPFGRDPTVANWEMIFARGLLTMTGTMTGTMRARCGCSA